MDKFYRIQIVLSIPDYQLCEEHQEHSVTGLDYITIGDDCQIHEISESEMLLVEKESAIFQQEVLRSINQLPQEEGK